MFSPDFPHVFTFWEHTKIADAAKMTKLNSVSKNTVKEEEERRICAHREPVYRRRVGAVVLKEELDTDSKYGLSRQQGGWLQRAQVY